MGSATCVPDAPPLVREALRFRRTVQRPADLVATFRDSGVYLECATDPPAVPVVHVAGAPWLPVFSDLRYFADYRRRRGEGDRAAEYLVLTGARLLDGYLPGMPQGTNVLLDPLQEHAVALHGITPESIRATEGFTESAQAMQRYRDVLAWAQRQAKQARADVEPCREPGTARSQASIDAAKGQVEDAAKDLVKTLLLTAEKAPSQQYGETIGGLVSGTLSAGKAFIGAGIDSFAEDPSGFVGQLAGGEGAVGHRVPVQRSDERSPRAPDSQALRAVIPAPGMPYPQGVPVTRQVILFGDRPFPADARWWVDGESVVLEIAATARTFRSRGENLFRAMLDIRLNQLEPNGLVLVAAGARYDVWSAPEGHFPGPHGSVHDSSESVDLLATVEKSDIAHVVPVRDQLDFHDRHA
ncbi:hypothetical protein AB0I53_12935 [Saccharopolyspora sp. NPDC050389]|uniref:hypothetical protein n=1 Tax=Saccharopolyspora sp. NPDC050389 TaxID=3155516 RepID=UPI003401F559